MTTLYANPYSSACRGFYFKSPQEFNRLYKEQEFIDGDDFGAKCEEYEIMFIDGGRERAEHALSLPLFRAMQVNQGNVDDYFVKLNELKEADEAQLAVLFFLMQHSGYDLNQASELVEQALLGEGKASDAAYDYFDDMGGVEVLSDEDLALHLDYEGLGVALYTEGVGDPEQSEREISYEWLEQFGRSTSDAPRQVLIDNFDMESWITDMAANGELRQIEYNGKTYTIFNAASIGR